MHIQLILPEDEGRGGVYPDGWTGANLVVVGRMKGNVSIINCERETESSVLMYSRYQAMIGQTYLYE